MVKMHCIHTAVHVQVPLVIIDLFPLAKLFLAGNNVCFMTASRQ